MGFVVIGGIVVGLTVLGVVVDAITRRRGAGKGQWADDQAHAQFEADQAADRWKPPPASNSPSS